MGGFDQTPSGYVPQASPLDVVYAKAYGARADAKIGTNGSINASSTSFSDPGAAFTAADVGKSIVINAATTGSIGLATTIAGYVSPTQVTLAAAASLTASGVYYAYGTDDTAAIQAAVNAAAALTTGKVTVVLEDALHMIAGALVTTNGYNAQITLPNVATSANKLGVTITGRTPDVEITPYDGTGALTVQGCALVTTLGANSQPAFSATAGVPSVIGGPASGRTGQAWTNIQARIKGLTILFQHFPYGFGVDLGNCLQADVSHVRVATNEPFGSQGQPAQSVNGGVIMPQQNNDAVAKIDRCEFHGLVYGLIPGEHTQGGYIGVYHCDTGIGIGSNAGGHAMHFGYLSSEANLNHIGGVSTNWNGAANTPIPTPGATIVIDLWDIEDAASGNFLTNRHLQDGNNVLTLEANLAKAKAGIGIGYAGQNGGMLVSGGFSCNIKDVHYGVGNVGSPTVPASGASSVVQNAAAGQIWRPCAVTITGGTVTAIALDTAPATGLVSGTIIVPPNHTFKITYTVAPSLSVMAL